MLFVVLAVAAGLVHLPYLLNDFPLWDGEIYTLLHSLGDKQGFMQPWIDNGRTPLGLIYWNLFELLGAGYGFRTFVLCLIAWGGLEFSKLVIDLYPGISKLRFQILAGLLYVSFPAFHVHAGYTTVVYAMFVPFFVRALRLALLPYSLKQQTQIAFLLAISLVSEALLTVSVVGGAAIFFLRSDWKEKNNKIARALIFFIFPVIYWIVMKLLFPVQGLYSESRSLDLNPLHVFYLLYKFVNVGLNFELFAFLRIKYLLLAWSVGFMLMVRKNISMKIQWRVFVFSIFLVLFGALPFVLSSRGVDTRGWSARHYTATGFSFGLLYWSIISLFPLRFESQKQWALSFMVAGFSVTAFLNDSEWLGRNKIDKEIVTQLKAIPALAGETKVKIQSFRPAMNEELRIYEWATIFYRAYGNFDRALLHESEDWNGALSYNVLKDHQMLSPKTFQHLADLRCGAELKVEVENLNPVMVGLRYAVNMSQPISIKLDWKVRSPECAPL